MTLGIVCAVKETRSCPPLGVPSCLGSETAHVDLAQAALGVQYSTRGLLTGTGATAGTTELFFPELYCPVQ